MSRTSTLTRLSLLTLCALSVFGVGVASTPAQSNAADTTQLLVRFRPDLPPTANATALAAVEGTDVQTIPQLGVHVVDVPSGRAAAALAAPMATHVMSLRSRTRSSAAGKVFPTIPAFPWQYAIGGNGGAGIRRTTQAWDITTGSASVVIAVLDTGLKTAGLSDFDGQLILSGWNVLSNSSDTSSQAENHGTYVAGVVEARGQERRRWLRVLSRLQDHAGSGRNRCRRLGERHRHRPRVGGRSRRPRREHELGGERLGDTAERDRLRALEGPGADGRRGQLRLRLPTYPAAYPNVLAVGGTDSSGNKAGDSNYGSWVTLAAPESNVTAWPTINGAPGYAPVGGTSLAAPVVAGIAGLLFGYDPSLTNTQVEQALEQTAARFRSPSPTAASILAALESVGAVDPQPASSLTWNRVAWLYYELNGTTSIAPLSSAPQAGQTLVRGIGGWKGSAGLTVGGLQWQRCSGTGSNCVGVTSAATAGAVNRRRLDDQLVFSVTNGLGSAGLDPHSTGRRRIAAAARRTVDLRRCGDRRDGSGRGAGVDGLERFLVEQPGGYAYQWQRCDGTGTNCATLGGATSTSYRGRPLMSAPPSRSRHASNSGGSAVATSAQTALVSRSARRRRLPRRRRTCSR